MKLLFLDIDGVLNSNTFYEANKLEIARAGSSIFWRSVAELNPEACALVNKFCDDNDLQIVISSTWRKLHDRRDIQTMFAKRGLFTEIIATTPNLKGNWRGNEIKAFLKEHPSLQVEAYVIFDDDSDFDADQPLVRTSWSEGLKEEHIVKAQEILNGQLAVAA